MDYRSQSVNSQSDDDSGRKISSSNSETTTNSDVSIHRYLL